MEERKPKAGYSESFCLRLLALMKSTGSRQEDVAQAAGVKRQTVGYWCSGKTVPDAIALGKIASYFNVTTDYLLGQTACPSMEADVRAVCDYTGLSAYAVEVLKDLPPYLLDIVNFLVSHPLFQQALWSTERASRLWMDYQQNESSIRKSEEDADGEIILAEDYLSKHFIECMPYDHASDLYMEDAKTKIGTILQQIVNGQ